MENLAQPLSEETRDHQDLMVRADLQVNLETTEPLEMTENLVHPDKLVRLLLEPGTVKI